jgi:hypothetical protein
MAGRKKHDELAFGSDSFLDVVANVVGILIILMVIAGLRVSRAPAVPVVTSPSPEVTPATEPVAVAKPVPAPEQPEETEPAPPDVVTVEEPPPPPKPALPPSDLVARARELQARMVGLTSDIEESQRRHGGMERKRSDLATQLSSLQQSLPGDEQARATAERQSGDAQASLRELQNKLAGLQGELRSAAAESPSTQVLQHRVTPISRQVDGQEAHFRLAGGRVSIVPLDALGNELKFRIERNRDSVMRLQRYDGSIGPVEGYKMHYVIERIPVSVLEELQFGQGYIRMGLSFYELEPLPELVAETAEEALSRSSRFRRELDRAGPDTTVTFWVYPDSFELHRRLLEYVHAAGLDVAARPLPLGVPIAGSPNGSKSMAQ